MDWISIKDKLPPAYKNDFSADVKIKTSDNKTHTGWYDHYVKKWYRNIKYDMCTLAENTTHWMPKTKSMTPPTSVKSKNA